MAVASMRQASSPAAERFSTPGARPSTRGNGYVAILTRPLAAGPCRSRADRSTVTLAGVTATVGSTAPGLDTARRTAKSAWGPMWLVAKKGIRRMRSFLLCFAEAMAGGSLCLSETLGDCGLKLKAARQQDCSSFDYALNNQELRMGHCSLDFPPVTLDTISLRNLADLVTGELAAMRLYSMVSTSPIVGRFLSRDTTLNSCPSRAPPSFSTISTQLSPPNRPPSSHRSSKPLFLLSRPRTSSPVNEYTTSKDPTKPRAPPPPNFSLSSSSSKLHAGLNSTAGLASSAAAAAITSSTCAGAGARNTAASQTLSAPGGTEPSCACAVAAGSPLFSNSRTATASASAEGQTSSSLAGAPFLDTPAPPENTSNARRAREPGESSTTGISARNRGCRRRCCCLLSFLAGTELLSGFCSALARQDRAWATASSLDDGGDGVLAAPGGGDVDECTPCRSSGLLRRRERLSGGDWGGGAKKPDERVGSGESWGLSAALEGGRLRRLFKAIGAAAVAPSAQEKIRRYHIPVSKQCLAIGILAHGIVANKSICKQSRIIRSTTRKL
ncbi:hypothetical protein U9M48_044468 [Paspalum notatum var. saurae]|uniref:Uncharacterized protein n=1 Tax=Paspalum notatum var. saurae TaxID=547442 RepID=A0AAQ3UVQ2_PASNO